MAGLFNIEKHPAGKPLTGAKRGTQIAKGGFGASEPLASVCFNCWSPKSFLVPKRVWSTFRRFIL